MSRKHTRPIQDPNLAETFEDLKSDYYRTKGSRFRRIRLGVPTQGAGADYHYRNESEYFHRMELARDYDRNDVLLGNLVDRACYNTIQQGIAVNPATPDEALNDAIKADFLQWANEPDLCDLSGERTFWEMQWIALRQMIVDGDICGLPNRSGKLELVEAHRLRTPRNTRRNVVLGILLDEVTRQPLEYWFTKGTVDPWKTVDRVGDMQQIAARDEQGKKQVYHLYKPARASQTRGVTAFNRIFDAAGMFEDINFATLIQKQMVSCFAVIEEMEGKSDIPVPSPEADTSGPTQTEQFADGTSRTLEGVGPAMWLRPAKGRRVKMDSPNVPNADHNPFMREIIQLIGLNLGLPLIFGLMDASETNYSGWRGAQEQAKLGFRNNQATIYRRLIYPTYCWRVRRLIAMDRAVQSSFESMGNEIFKAVPGFPSFPYTDPYKDASADLLLVGNSLISQRRRFAQRDIDFSDHVEEVNADNAKVILAAKRTAQEINRQFPDDPPLGWRDVYYLPTPEGTSINKSEVEQQVNTGNTANTGNQTGAA